MKVICRGIELFPSQFKGCFITRDKVKLVNSDTDIKEYSINEVTFVSDDSQRAINSLKQENEKLQNDIKDLLGICEENGICVEDDNGNTVVNGRRNGGNHHHTEEVVYEDNSMDGVSGLLCGVALGSLLF